jgi:hypothetical protein
VTSAKRLVAVALAGGLLAAGGGGAYAALVRVPPIVVRADATFTPSTLPAKAYAPITIRGFLNISSTEPGPPPPLVNIVLDLDHNGRIETRGLPVCRPGRLEGTRVTEARKACAGAIVATGHVEALIDYPDRPPIPVRAPLTVFNGPADGRNPSVVFHSYTWIPDPTTYIVPAEIIKAKRGPYGFQVEIDVPPIADGYGSLTHGDAKIGKLFKHRGRKRSYVSARCANAALTAHGRLTFANGTIIEGDVYRPCNVAGR